MSAIEATRGDQSSGYHIHSLMAFQCPLAAESRVHSHHCFVRSSPDSGGGSSDSPLDSQSKGSAIFYALDSGRGLCHPGRSPCCWPRLAQGPAITALCAVGRFEGSKFEGVCACACVCEEENSNPAKVQTLAIYCNGERNGDMPLRITGTGDCHTALVCQAYQNPDSELAWLRQANEG